MTFKSAAGYGGLENTPLNQPGYYNKIINRVWETDFIPEIVNTEIDERIVACNQIVQFTKQPQVSGWRDYDKNQELIPNQITPEGFCMTICEAKYNDIKIDKLDIKYICDRWDAWEASFLESAYQSLVAIWRDWVLNAMILETDVNNAGTRAGIRHNINLGAPGAPIVVNKDNIATHLVRLKQVLRDRQRWQDGQMFVVLPTAIEEVLVNSNYANKMWVGQNCGNDCSMLIDGQMASTLAGFNVFESSHVPVFIDSGTGQVCYYIIAGHRDAFAFAGDLVEGRLVEPSRAFGVEYQMLAVWGGKAIYPDALAYGYWTFEV